MDRKLGSQLAPLVLEDIRAAYEKGELIKTLDCMKDMVRDGLYEADVEKVIHEATEIEKAMDATSNKATNPKNTHYAFYGESTQGLEVYCKCCTNYHPTTDEFICWRLTSFCKKD